MKITPDFSERLAQVMAERGLRQADLATMLGVAQATVSAWLNGAVPQRRTARTLCEKLEVGEDWLIYGTEPLNRGKRNTPEKVRLGIVKPLALDETKSLSALASNLRAIRDSVAVGEFSKMVGVSKSKVYLRYESGSVPRPVILQRMALRIGLTVSELLAPLSAARVKEVQSQNATSCAGSRHCARSGNTRDSFGFDASAARVRDTGEPNDPERVYIRVEGG